MGYSYLARAGRGTAHTHAPENWGNLLIVPYLRLLESTHTHTYTVKNANTHIHKQKYTQEPKETQTRIQS